MIIFGGILLVGHFIATGIALVATWYFGHLAEKKILKEARDIHKEITDKIKEMDKADAEYDKIDAFLAQQGQILSGFRSEIGRSIGVEIGSIIDDRLNKLPQGAAGARSTKDRIMDVIENATAVAAAAVMQG